MIKVYESSERLFNHNGLKILHPLRADITKIDNGDYCVELQDTIDNLDYYQNGMIVRIPTPWGEQGFRLSNPLVENRRITVKGWHLTYDAEKYAIEDAYAVDKNCNDALDHFNSNTDTETPFTTISDITTLCSTRIVRKNLFEAYEQLISADRYGGHWFRDNWTLGIKHNIGQDRGVVLSVGKNITDIKISEDWDNVCTKIFPHTTDGKVAVTLDEGFIELSEQLYDVPYTRIVKFENNLKLEDFANEEDFVATIKEQLRLQAVAYLEENKTPKVNYSVTANIDNVSDVGDVIKVIHPKCKVNILTNVISVQYDAIRKKYIKIEFGNFKRELKNLSDALSEKAKEHTDNSVEEVKVLLRSELAESTSKINGVLGNSYVIYEGDKILVVDELPKENATYVIKISNGGIGFSSTGINGTFTSAWTIDGTLNMQNINVINLTASLIKGGTLKLGGVNNSSGTFELYDNSNNLMVLMDKLGLTVYAKDRSYVKLNAEEGFAGYSNNGVKTYWADGETFHMKNAEIDNEMKVAGRIKIVPVTTGEHTGIGFVAIS